MDKPPKVICGARNRQGQPCQKPPMRGKKRCLAHGGKTPKGQNAGKANGNHKHGLYSSYLTADEQAIWDEIQVGTVDQEIRMAKIMLNRALKLQASVKETLTV